MSPLRSFAHRVGSAVIDVIKRFEEWPPHVVVSQVVVVGGNCGGEAFREEVKAFIEKGCVAVLKKRVARLRSAGKSAEEAAAASPPVVVRVPVDGSIYVATGAALYRALGNTSKRMLW